MTRRDKGGLLCCLTIPLILSSGYCFYRAVDAGITAEEGMKYSVPAMKADPKYSKQFVSDEESDLRKLNSISDQWGAGAGALFLVGLVAGGAGIWMERSVRGHSSSVAEG